MSMKYFKFTHDSLAKFCPPEYNIQKGCNTIRFGTLYGFREEENEKLRDSGEGAFTFSVEFPKPTKVSNEWLACFETEGGNNGKSFLYLSYFESNGTDTTIHQMDMSGSCPNCWIYCVSCSADSAGNISETHQDKWLIPSESIGALAHHFGSLIHSNLKASDLPAEISDYYSLSEIQQRLSIHVRCGLVEYTSRTIHIKDESELPISKVEELKEQVAFTKPASFKAEREFRMAFWLTFDGKKVSIPNNAKIVNLRQIDKILTPSPTF